MTRRLYTLLMWLLQPGLRAKLARRGAQEPLYLHAVEERFGQYGTSAWPADGNCVWIHAVSLGETRAAAVLIAALRERLPAMRLLLTHGTATGRTEGARLLRAGDAQVWQPWDTPGHVARFLTHFKPRIGLLMETEMWPNLSAACTQAGVPLALVNARLSEKSLRQAQRLSWLARPAYQSLAAAWAQTQDDGARLGQLGANVQGVYGNLKFDATPEPTQWALGRAWRALQDKPVVMFASSREGEEALWLATIKSAPASVQWLIVPRHPQRFDEVAALLRSHGLTVSRRSEWQTQPQPAQVWLGDSLGEMALYFGLSHAALLGGSYAPLGGQNLIEAAACACPVFMGPHTYNFSEAAELALAAGAAQRCADLNQAVVAAFELVSQPTQQAAMASAASTFATAHRGATQRTVDAVLGLLKDA